MEGARAITPQFGEALLQPREFFLILFVRSFQAAKFRWTLCLTKLHDEYELVVLQQLVLRCAAVTVQIIHSIDALRFEHGLDHVGARVWVVRSAG